MQEKSLKIAIFSSQIKFVKYRCLIDNVALKLKHKVNKFKTLE